MLYAENIISKCQDVYVDNILNNASFGFGPSYVYMIEHEDRRSISKNFRVISNTTVITHCELYVMLKC